MLPEFFVRVKIKINGTDLFTRSLPFNKDDIFNTKYLSLSIQKKVRNYQIRKTAIISFPAFNGSLS